MPHKVNVQLVVVAVITLMTLISCSNSESEHDQHPRSSGDNLKPDSNLVLKVGLTSDNLPYLNVGEGQAMDYVTNLKYFTVEIGDPHSQNVSTIKGNIAKDYSSNKVELNLEHIAGDQKVLIQPLGLIDLHHAENGRSFEGTEIDLIQGDNLSLQGILEKTYIW